MHLLVLSILFQQVILEDSMHVLLINDLLPVFHVEVFHYFLDSLYELIFRGEVADYDFLGKLLRHLLYALFDVFDDLLGVGFSLFPPALAHEEIGIDDGE